LERVTLAVAAVMGTTRCSALPASEATSTPLADPDLPFCFDGPGCANLVNDAGLASVGENKCTSS